MLARREQGTVGLERPVRRWRPKQRRAQLAQLVWRRVAHQGAGRVDERRGEQVQKPARTNRPRRGAKCRPGLQVPHVLRRALL